MKIDNWWMGFSASRVWLRNLLIHSLTILTTSLIPFFAKRSGIYETQVTGTCFAYLFLT